MKEKNNKYRSTTASSDEFPLNQLYFYLTEGCNLACRHCYLAPKFDPDGKKHPILPLKLFNIAVEEALPLGLSGVKLSGGEPLLHPDILTMLDILNQEKLALVMETNGVLLTMEIVNIVMCGLGGQGILFMTKVLSHTAMAKGFKTLGAETHGMAQRGGSVISHLRLGDVESSLIRAGTAHFLLSLDEHEAYRNLSFLAGGAGMYVNVNSNNFPQENVKAFLDQRKVEYRSFPAGKMAMELKAPLSSNLALLGFFSSANGIPVSYEEMRKTIADITPDRLREINLRVFDAGYHEGLAKETI